MAERRTGFIGIAAMLGLIAFAAGFAISLASIGKSGVMYRFALAWELTRALLYVAAWAPAMVLVASALAMESSDAVDGFSEAANAVLTPTLVLAAVISIFFLLVVPGLEERANRYESQSGLFAESLGLAEEALRSGELDDAAGHLLTCAAIDARDPRYEALNDRVQSASIRADSAEAEAAARVSSGQAPKDETPWAAGNRFYLEALKARSEGRLFDAHYLAKRSVALYSKRPEVRQLVDETWRALERLDPTEAELRAEAFYKRKLEGYARFQEGDFLEAYRIYSELAADDRDDMDVQTYLARSTEGLATIAFFTEEYERAFSRSDEPTFSMSFTGPDGSTTRLAASRAAVSDEAVYFRDVALSRTGGEPMVVRTPFARLHGDTLILRAVDRRNPDIVFNPIYESGGPVAGGLSAGGRHGDPGHAVRLPFGQEDAVMALRLSGDPGDVPLALLATGIDDAESFGLDVKPLRTELARRAAYPFSVLMLALVGAGLGVRFKPAEKPGTAMKYLTAPILVALAVAPLRIAAGLGTIAAGALATMVPGSMFLAAWLGFMGLCVAASLLVAARIAASSR